MESNLEDNLDQELERSNINEIFSSKYRNKKLFLYIIRTSIAIILYVYFWNYEYVRFSLWIYIPLNLIGLSILLFTPYFLKRKIERTRKLLGETDDFVSNYFSNISLTEASLKARGDKAALLSEKLKFINLSRLSAEITTFNTDIYKNKIASNCVCKFKKKNC